MILSVSECISVSRSLYHNVALWQSSLDDNLSHTDESIRVRACSLSSSPHALSPPPPL